MSDFITDVERQYEMYCKIAEEHGFIDLNAKKNGFRCTTKSNEFNAGWIAFVGAVAAVRDEQQAKIDELHKISVALNTETIRQREQVAYYLSKNAELQKRVDDLELTIKGAVTFVDLQIEATEQGREAAIGTQAKNWWSSKLLMLRPVRRVLEQALKGGDE